MVLLATPSASLGATDMKEGRIKTHDGYTLYYQRVGQGPEVVIIPGRLFLAESFKALASPRRTFVFYDMRNRGLSEHIADSTKISIHEDVRDLESVRRHFKANRFAVVGYSYLGLMVILYAMEHPERVERIVQLGPLPLKLGNTYPPEFDNRSDRSVFDGAKWEELQQLEREGLAKTNPRAFCEKEWEFMRVMLVGNPPTHLDRLPNPCAMPNEWPVNLRSHFRILFMRSIVPLEVSEGEVVARVTMPVLTIHGRKDRNAPYAGGREWAQLLPDARLLTLDNAAHNSWADEPDAVLSAVRVFLDGSWPEQAEAN
jgi:proline iminopeptidase